MPGDRAHSLENTHVFRKRHAVNASRCTKSA